jgi:uncharacterized protein (TIGR02145 family)
MFISTAGNVGIGTTTPYSKLTVWGSGTGTNALANFVNSASSTLMTILENGSVGIGTNSLSTSKFKVALSALSVLDSFNDQTKLASVSNINVSSGQLKLAQAVCGSYSVTGLDGLTYGTVVAEDGKCWLDRNLGAAQVATASNNGTGYGSLYQWGRLYDGHQATTSGTTVTQSSGDVPGNANFIKGSSNWRSSQNDNLWGDAGKTNNPCPSGWHVPTQAEWATEAGYFSPQTSVGAFSSALKLPMAGYRNYSDGSLGSQGSGGDYWSGSPHYTNAYVLDFGAGGVNPASVSDRAYGCSVRCVKD